MNDTDQGNRLSDYYDTHSAAEDAGGVVEAEVRRPLDKVIVIRLPAAKWETLLREANDLGIGPTTLARMWLLEKLREVERAGHVQKLKEHPR